MTKQNDAVLISDIGLTNARFGLVVQGQIIGVEVLNCLDFDTMHDAVHHYFSLLKSQDIIHDAPRKAVLAIAGNTSVPGKYFVVDHNWDIDLNVLQDECKFDFVRVLNDFDALAHGIAHLSDDDIDQIGRGYIRQGAAKIVIGPGSGLGVSSLVWTGDAYIPVAGEGGHVHVCVNNQQEFDVISWLSQNMSAPKNILDQGGQRISVETVCSGAGLVNIYHALMALNGHEFGRDNGISTINGKYITDKMIHENDAIATQSWHMMIGFLGRAAANMALSLCAHGGVYLGGGILQKIPQQYWADHFRQEFENCGKLRPYIENMPSFLIKHPYPAFLGLKTFV